MVINERVPRVDHIAKQSAFDHLGSYDSSVRVGQRLDLDQVSGFDLNESDRFAAVRARSGHDHLLLAASSRS